VKQNTSPLHSLWPDWQQPAQEMLRVMLGELQGLAITGGEASVRLSPEGVDNGRWLAGFSPVGVAASRLMALPQSFGMPEEWAEHFRENCQRVRQIYLALSQTKDQVQAKVYLEHPLSAPDLRTTAPEKRQVALQIESCKWDLSQAETKNFQCTEYWRVSGLDGRAMVELLRQAQDLAPVAQSVYAGVSKILETALHAKPDWQGYRLLSVREPVNGRLGVCVRFYGSEMPVSAVAPAFLPIFAEWGVSPQRLSELMTVWRRQELGWLHAGLDAAGQAYLNVYGALNRAETRAVLSQAGAGTMAQKNNLPDITAVRSKVEQNQLVRRG